jgi:beta-glucosidase
MGATAVAAVRSGAAREQSLDDKVRRLLRTLHRAGRLEHADVQPEESIDRPEHRRLARVAAAEGIVLLKNRQAILPLDPQRQKSVAVIGENARRPAYRGGGSTTVHPHYVVAPLDAIRSRARVAMQISYAVGCAAHRDIPLFDRRWLTGNLSIECFSNPYLRGAPVRTETARRTEWYWPFPAAADLSVRITGSFVVPEGGAYELGLSSTARSRLFIDGREIINLWDAAPSQEGGRQSADVELAAGIPYPLCVEYASQPGGLAWHSLRLGGVLKVPADSIRQAVALAAEADVAIVFAGLTDEWESEGYDRPDMELPGDQATLIEMVTAANPHTIVVLNGGSPIAMRWLDQAAAVVEAWYLGQETGNAIADVLFGDVNPSGKLPTTFPKRLHDNPAYLNYPGENGKVHYGEGIFVGYRYYDKKEIAPLFPFGYGLSYTTFVYRRLTLRQSPATAGEAIRLSVEVENTGSRAGQEIVQVYVRQAQSRLSRPEKELKAFAKIALEPGETRTVELSLDRDAFSYYDTAVGRWVIEPGKFEVLVGGSSRDVCLADRFTFNG